MPPLQAIIDRFNFEFAPDRIARRVEAAPDFSEGTSLVEALKGVGIVTESVEEEYMMEWPNSLLESLRAAIHAYLTGPEPARITMSWTPGYDFQFTFSEAVNTRDTSGGVTVQASSPYPDDARLLARRQLRSGTT